MTQPLLYKEIWHWKGHTIPEGLAVSPKWLNSNHTSSSHVSKYVLCIHLLCLWTHFTPSVAAQGHRGHWKDYSSTPSSWECTVPDLQCPAQWWSSLQKWCIVTKAFIDFCQSSGEELAFWDKEPVFWSGDFAQCSSTTCSECVSKQIIWRN